ncbi:hypothetical protein [Piscinibacter sp.]|uniref:hypothetical protein n=1 Tax=Piscinibacter sp. TaxID=1903157 RepID=UPI002BCB22C9|nr:hypothetical protein [Albitalea sp.]HUG25663.1 hypothetical protein [Albitalea sp.]
MPRSRCRSSALMYSAGSWICGSARSAAISVLLPEPFGPATITSCGGAANARPAISG